MKNEEIIHSNNVKRRPVRCSGRSYHYNYTKHYESRGEDYRENYDAMIEWFDTDDFEFADWAKNNMNWSDVSDKAVLVKHIQPEPDFEDGWVDGEYRYYREEE